MRRRDFTLSAIAMAGCQTVTPINTPIAGTMVRNDGGIYAPTRVTDVSRTDLAGTVIYDEIIPFSLGSFTPANPATGQPHNGGTVTGGFQSRVTRSTNRGTLIFSYRFRDLVFQPGATGNPQKGSSASFIELVTLSGFDAGFFPMEAFNIDPSQSLGAEVWGAIGTAHTNGSLEFNSYYTEPEGTTFFELLTKATKYKTGKYLHVSHTAQDLAGNNVLSATGLDRIAVPTI